MPSLMMITSILSEESLAINSLGLGSATLLQLSFLGENDPNFPRPFEWCIAC